ncbi:phage tail protein [Salipiger sp. IMCC34102]|nr:phage tail protein [Salipiger sp. IMCC34102]
MARGAFRFAMSRTDYQTSRRAAAYRWESVDRAGRAPALQFAGPGTETITLSGTIYPSFAGSFRQMELMRAQAGLGVPMMLTDGMGFVWRKWAITEVNETRTLLFADGAPRKIDFDVTLTAYGEDRA